MSKKRLRRVEVHVVKLKRPPGCRPRRSEVGGVCSARASSGFGVRTLRTDEVGGVCSARASSGFDVRTLRADEVGGVCSARASGVRHSR